MRTFPGCALPALTGLLALGLMAVSACEPAVPGIVDGSDEGCPPARRSEVISQGYFDDTMVPTIFATYCSHCHWSGLTGDARHGAPEGLDYDDMESAVSRNGATWFRVSTYNMPPMGRVPSLDEMAVLNEWLNCTLPVQGDDDDSAL